MRYLPRLSPRTFDRHVEWVDGEFSAVGALGKCSVPFKEWSKSSYAVPEIEYAPIKHERQKDFLAMFIVRPATHLDITAVHLHRSRESSLYLIGTDLILARNMLEILMDKLCFQPQIPTQHFINDLQQDIPLQAIGIYQTAMWAGPAAGMSPERFSGIARYTSFLTRYHHLTQEAAEERASKSFHITQLF
mgnify:CR=1 FL=1